MGPPENNTASKEAKVKDETDQLKFQMQHLWKKSVFTPKPLFDGACRALTGRTFSGHRPKGFKAPLYNISIYFGATYGHDMGMALNYCKEDIIPLMDEH